MSPENFIYWLQGFLEIADPAMLDDAQITIIKNHIKLVLTKVTPDIKIDPLGFDRIPKRSLRIAVDPDTKECSKAANIEMNDDLLVKLAKFNMQGPRDGKIC